MVRSAPRQCFDRGEAPPARGGAEGLWQEPSGGVAGLATRKDPEVASRVRIAWLPEDETTTSFWKFLRILRPLGSEYGEEFPPCPASSLKMSRMRGERRF